MSPLASIFSLWSSVFTCTWRKCIVLSVPLITTLKFSGMVNRPNTGANGRAMSLSIVRPVIIEVLYSSLRPCFLLGNCTMALSKFIVVFRCFIATFRRLASRLFIPASRRISLKLNPLTESFATQRVSDMFTVSLP